MAICGNVYINMNGAVCWLVYVKQMASGEEGAASSVLSANEEMTRKERKQKQTNKQKWASLSAQKY